MITLLVILHLIVNVLGFPSQNETNPDDFIPNLEGRIVGGITSPISDFPYQVSLQLMGQHYCGGSIISKEYILTAAHCLKNIDVAYIKVRAGSSYFDSGGQLISVEKSYIYPKYDPDTSDNDIAILKLKKPLTLGSNVQVIKMIEYRDIPAGATAYISGWGKLGENDDPARELQSVQVKMIGWKTCKKRFENGVITRSMVCAGHKEGEKDACQGDSGGPLVVDNILVGVISWGVGCARANIPGIYTNISRFRTFIKFITRI